MIRSKEPCVLLMLSKKGSAAIVLVIRAICSGANFIFIHIQTVAIYGESGVEQISPQGYFSYSNEILCLDLHCVFPLYAVE